MARSEKWDRLDVGGVSEVPNVPELMSKVSIRTGLMRFSLVYQTNPLDLNRFQMALTVLGKWDLAVLYTLTIKLIDFYDTQLPPHSEHP